MTRLIPEVLNVIDLYIGPKATFQKIGQSLSIIVDIFHERNGSKLRAAIFMHI